jgi:hypothetical protein
MCTGFSKELLYNKARILMQVLKNLGTGNPLNV